MSKIPESKQKRLQSLNQDILAVSADRAGASASDGEPPRRPGSTPGPAPASSQVPAVRLPVMLALVTLLLLVAVTIVGAMLLAQKSRQLDALQQQLPPLQSRLGELEERLLAADREVEGSGAEVQSNVLQLSTRVRRMDSDLSRLQSELRRSGRSNEETETRLGQLESALSEQRRRLAAMGDQQPAAAPAPAPSVSEQEFADLSRQVDRLNADIRALYRILEGR